MNYEFDIQTRFPQRVFNDPAYSALMREAGIKFDGHGNKVAQFRDPKTAQFIASAPEHIRKFFEESGFGFEHYKSGAPSGYFPIKDAKYRQLVLHRLAENTRSFNLEWLHKSPFSFSDFITTTNNSVAMNDEDLMRHIGREKMLHARMVRKLRVLTLTQRVAAISVLVLSAMVFVNAIA